MWLLQGDQRPPQVYDTKSHRGRLKPNSKLKGWYIHFGTTKENGCSLSWIAKIAAIVANHLMSKRTLTWTWYCLPYIATTQIWHLEDYSMTTLFEIKSFCKWTHKIQGSTMQLKKTLQLCKLTWSLRKQPSNLWMLLFCLYKTWESFVFKKKLWSDNLPSSALVCVGLHTILESQF